MNIITTPDCEMKDAINEFNQAQTMFDNAFNKWRIDEAIARLNAANIRIRAIRHERGVPMINDYKQYAIEIETRKGILLECLKKGDAK